MFRAMCRFYKTTVLCGPPDYAAESLFAEGFKSSSLFPFQNGKGEDTGKHQGDEQILLFAQLFL